MREVVHSDKAPAAVGPYSQAIAASGKTFLFCSGQIPLSPETGEMVGTSAAEQCVQVMENLGAVLKAGGTDFGGVVKATIYLVDMADFGAVNEVYARYFPSEPPARACFQVCRLPKDARVEIEAVAVV
ncbi:MAG: RidA family protein [candidate division Zixibacteria bacterium]|nr:RidA family protein [candidate division Zixibacteria bacterium]